MTGTEQESWPLNTGCGVDCIDSRTYPVKKTKSCVLCMEYGIQCLTCLTEKIFFYKSAFLSEFIFLIIYINIS